MGPSRDPFRVFDDPAAQDDGLVEEEGSDDEPGPQANLGVRTTPPGLTLPKLGLAAVQRPREPSGHRRHRSGFIGSTLVAPDAGDLWVALAASRNDTTCGPLTTASPSGDSPAHLLVIQEGCASEDVRAGPSHYGAPPE
jgi:hypothetical protein